MWAISVNIFRLLVLVFFLCFSHGNLKAHKNGVQIRIPPIFPHFLTYNMPKRIPDLLYLGMFIMALTGKPNKIKQISWWFQNAQNDGYVMAQVT